MKRLYSSLLTALCALALAAPAQAQQEPALLIYRGQVVVNMPASSAGHMTYGQGADGPTVSIAGATYATATVDSIVVAPGAAIMAEKSVNVIYDGATAQVVMSGDVAPYVTATIDGAHVTLTASADVMDEYTYTLSGASTDGSLTLDGEFKCTVTLDGLSLESRRGAALDIQNGKRINVNVNGANALADCATGLQKACFFMNGHAEFRGSGSLSLTGRKAHAYASDEYTSLRESFTGSLNVLAAAGDGLHIDQYFEQKNGRVDIRGCAGDGIDCDTTKDATDELNGQILISGGSLSVDMGASADVKGLKATDSITVTGGALTIRGTGDGQKGIKTSSSLVVTDAVSAPTLDIAVTGTTYHPGLADESKTRGIKVDGNFTLDGGTLRVSATGAKAKAVSVDGTFYYGSGSYNCVIDAADMVEI